MNDIKIKTDNQIGFILLNRAPVNALSKDFVSQLSSALDKFVKLEVKCLIIHSKLKHFCAGADLKERQKMDENCIISAVKAIQDCFAKIYSYDIPIISVINGAALGGGIELALSCDFRIAEEGSFIGFPETELGIIPGAGGTQRLARLIGISKAKYYILTGERIDSKKALEIGLVDFQSKEGKGVSDAVALAKKIKNKKKSSIVNSKKAINNGFDLPIREALKVELDCYIKSRK